MLSTKNRNFGAAGSFGASAEVRIKPGYPTLVTDPEVTDKVRRVAAAQGFPAELLTTMNPIGGGEDFAYYCEKVPGSFVFVGAGNADKACIFPHHHPRFNIDEDVLVRGAAFHAGFALAGSLT